MKKLLIIGCLVASTQIHAKDCFNIDSSSEAKECFSKKLDLADKKLLSTYQSKLKNLEPENKQQLIKAQRLWVQFKEADCLQVANQFDDRTGSSLLGFQCLINKSIAREKELEQR